MPDNESSAHRLAKALQKIFERPPAPLSAREQRRRYRRRRRSPDWVWGVAVGLLVSGAIATAILLGQKW